MEWAIPDDPDYARNGLLVPNQLTDKIGITPLDFTSLSSRSIGQFHSYFANRHAHLIFLIGNLKAEIGNTKHDLNMAEEKWMRTRADDFKEKWRAEAAMGRDKEIKKMRAKLRQAQAVATKYEALSESYQGMRNAASREIERRKVEKAMRDI